MLKNLALLFPQIRRLHEHRNALLARVAELEAAKSAATQVDEQLRMIEGRVGHLEELAQNQSRELHGAHSAAAPVDEQLRGIEGRLVHLEDLAQNQSRKLDAAQMFSNVHFPVWASNLEFQLRDVLEGHLASHPLPELGWSIVAERRVAMDTNDHLFPRGTKNDNSRHPRFVQACEKLLGPSLKHLDLGCAGGGLVWDFTRRSHSSVGVEGSDYSLRTQRAEWRTIPDRLFTADICYPFHFQDRDGQRVLFDVISAWELFEHIPEGQLQGLLDNITSGLRPGGYLAASIATFLDRDEATGVIYHHTVQPREWWEERFRSVGLTPVAGALETGDFVRGSGNPTAYDWDVRLNPEMGFHIVLRYGQ